MCVVSLTAEASTSVVDDDADASTASLTSYPPETDTPISLIDHQLATVVTKKKPTSMPSGTKCDSVLRAVMP